MFHIYVFRAIDDPDQCQAFAKGHAEVLKSYGIKKLTSTEHTWMADTNVYIVAVKDVESQEMVGGVRIHLTNLSARVSLPVEQALGSLDDKVSALIDDYLRTTGQKVSELCALWNARKVWGKGLALLVCRACVARSGLVLFSQLGVGCSLAFCAHWTVRMFKDFGYVAEERVGSQGIFPYPKPNLSATMMITSDIHNLNKATPDNRESIFNLRQHPVQKKMEVYKNKSFKVSYDLEL